MPRPLRPSIPVERVRDMGSPLNVQEALTRAERLDPALLRTARDRAAATGRRLIVELEELAGMDPERFLKAVGASLHYPVLGSDALFACAPDFTRIALTEGLQRECLILETADGARIGVIADPFDTARLAWLEERLQGALLFLVHPGDLAAFLARHEEEFRAVDNVATAEEGGATGGDVVEKLSLASISEDASMVVKLVNSTLYDALKTHASDIHLESTASGLVIKYRIDGVLNLAGKTQGVEVAEQVISRIKVMAELDIAERRTPQDGRFKVEIKGREIDFRVSIMPSIYGEDAVLRILDKQDLADQTHGVRLDALGFDAASVRTLRRLANDPYGMILVTGPTGSGKTTTLYAMISEINHGQDKIITIEDPVEYQLPGILQIPVNEKKGLTFARGLRSILRHDPDKIMVGEIRDPETAQIAVQSALTGHLVFTTIHANNVFDVIGRFTQMEVDPYSFVSALNAILAQRLVRMVCPHCAQPHAPDAQQLRDAGLDPEACEDFRFVAARGCGRCRGTGYKGRTAIAELLLLDDDLRQMIVDREPMPRVKEYARRHGLRLLRETAVDLVRRAETTLEEINRVTFVG